MFTGMDQDTSANVYDFPAREYGIQGRWPSPDPAGLLAVNPFDPQSWNRYGYVRNSPLELVDPTGLCPHTGFCEPPPPYGPGSPGGCSVDGNPVPCVIAVGVLDSGAAGTYDGFQVSYSGGEAFFVAPLGSQVTEKIQTDTGDPVMQALEEYELVPVMWTITNLVATALEAAVLWGLMACILGTGTT
jgi:RHS repeat-associated protein